MTTEPNSNPGLPPGDPFDALRAQAAAEFNPSDFLSGNKPLAALAGVMLSGWRCYYAARQDVVEVASDSLDESRSAYMVSYLVEAMKLAAQEPFSVADLLVQLESVVLPYVRDLVARSESKDE